MTHSRNGHVYAIARVDQYNAVKVGYTKSTTPIESIKRRYVTALSPLQILCLIPCGDAVVAEHVCHHVLRRNWRCNEIFDLQSKEYAEEQLHVCREQVQNLDRLAGFTDLHVNIQTQ